MNNMTRTFIQHNTVPEPAYLAVKKVKVKIVKPLKQQQYKAINSIKKCFAPESTCAGSYNKLWLARVRWVSY